MMEAFLGTQVHVLGKYENSKISMFKMHVLHGLNLLKIKKAIVPFEKSIKTNFLSLSLYFFLFI